MKNVYLNTFLFAVLFSAFTCTLFAQSTIITLPTVGTSSNFLVNDSANTTLMKLNADGGFCAFGNTGTGTIPATGSGTRLMWYPYKYAFRAGYVGGAQWNDANIGGYSTATGYNTTASAFYSTATGFSTTASASSSTAMGYSTTASSFASTAMGYQTNAGGTASTAMGFQTTAGKNYSTAMGYQTMANGDYSTAMGDSTTASGLYSTAMGYHTTASGISSTAIGDHVTASGFASTAMGYLTTAAGYASVAMGDPTEASGYTAIAMGHEVVADGDNSIALGNYATTNRHKGSFIFGDASTSEIVVSSADQEMTMRFDGGYRLFTYDNLETGVYLPHGASSWDVKSDSTKKERFVFADGEYFLNSLARLRLGSWNYKSQDPKSFRHYGPMAQEIFHYFGNDGIGTIGDDTTLATADMDGIMIICLQALEKRTNELQKANQKIAEQENRINSLYQKASEQEKTNTILSERMEKLEHMIASTSTNNAQKSTSSK
jgi:hypothetical protein